MTIVFTGTVFN